MAAPGGAVPPLPAPPNVDRNIVKQCPKCRSTLSVPVASLDPLGWTGVSCPVPACGAAMEWPPSEHPDLPIQLLETPKQPAHAVSSDDDDDSDVPGPPNKKSKPQRGRGGGRQSVNWAPYNEPGDIEPRGDYICEARLSCCVYVMTFRHGEGRYPWHAVRCARLLSSFLSNHQVHKGVREQSRYTTSIKRNTAE